MAESLLSSYVVRVVSGSEDAFQENYTYGIIREYVTMQSFQGLITRKVRVRVSVLACVRASVRG
jgi:hypothetical protein